MRPVEAYPHQEEWSDENQVHIGNHPDLITGIHGDDPAQVFKDLRQVLQEVVSHFQHTRRKPPGPRTRPMMEVS